MAEKSTQPRNANESYLLQNNISYSSIIFQLIESWVQLGFSLLLVQIKKLSMWKEIQQVFQVF